MYNQFNNSIAKSIDGVNMNNFKPVTAVTMGDPAGIGPEIVLRMMQEQELYNECKPFIIGSVPILQRAEKVIGLDKPVVYNKISDPSEAKYQYGVVDVMETGDYDCDSIEWGKVQELAGRMSVDFVMKSIELGKEGKIDAVSTAPIHKIAIKKAGVFQAGHTEIYQDETNSEYGLTMFSTHKLRVFFVSRHIALKEACDFASKEVVLQNIKNIDKELKLLNMENPLIAVAALNPHGGDDGLFGREEIDQLIPACEEAKKLGINVVGPLPADSVFYQGKDGRFDAILSLYHDQGHIACKTYDFEKSVTITFGLPFMRSSVDHGTAFDIAGKGIAQAVSMLESTLKVAEYSRMKKSRDAETTEDKRELVCH